MVAKKGSLMNRRKPDLDVVVNVLARNVCNVVLDNLAHQFNCAFLDAPLTFKARRHLTPIGDLRKIPEQKLYTIGKKITADVQTLLKFYDVDQTIINRLADPIEAKVLQTLENYMDNPREN